MIPQIYKSPQRWETREANKATSRIMETSNVKVNFLINLCDWKTFVCSEDVIFGGRRFPCFPSISHVLKGPLHLCWGCIKIQCLVLHFHHFDLFYPPTPPDFPRTYSERLLLGSKVSIIRFSSNHTGGLKISSCSIKKWGSENTAIYCYSCYNMLF